MAAVQIETFGDLLTDMAEKVGETTQNSADNRKRKINSAYFLIANKRNWWWLETSSTDTTTTSLSYSLPTNFVAFHPRNPVKIGSDWRVIVPFQDLQIYDGTSTVVALPQVLSKRKAYIYGSQITFIQESMSAGQTITYYYYRRATGMDELTDTPLMPIEFREMISLYAAGMYLKSQGGRESIEGNDYLELFDNFLKDMEMQDDTRRKDGIKRRALDPEEAAIFR